MTYSQAVSKEVLCFEIRPSLLSLVCRLTWSFHLNAPWMTKKLKFQSLFCARSVGLGLSSWSSHLAFSFICQCRLGCVYAFVHLSSEQHEIRFAVLKRLYSVSVLKYLYVLSEFIALVNPHSTQFYFQTFHQNRGRLWQPCSESNYA
jgi:hypothetical protein